MSNLVSTTLKVLAFRSNKIKGHKQDNQHQLMSPMSE